MVDMETQTVAAKFAFEFNERVRRTTAPSRYAIKFLLAKVGILEPSCAFALCLRAKMEQHTNSKRFIACTQLFFSKIVSLSRKSTLTTHNCIFLRCSCIIFIQVSSFLLGCAYRNFAGHVPFYGTRAQVPLGIRHDKVHQQL